MSALIQQLLMQCEPEKAHYLAQRLINLRYSRYFVSDKETFTFKKPVQLWGLDFPNPVGLAAGWDKNADVFDALFRMGFGFIEVGTVTPQPQMGNPKPRLFRLPAKKALINRMGFNNLGVDALVEKIKIREAHGILGVNIGKNKETELENALSDYQCCLEKVYCYADYVVINLSSPNTPGLRELQSAHYLNDLLQGIQMSQKNLSQRHHRTVPLLVKTTIDLPPSQLPDFVEALLNNKIDGLIISNTSIDHSSVAQEAHGQEVGGLSGAPIRERVTAMIQAVREISPALPIVGVGGILSADDAKAHMNAGAQLVQLFTGFVYRGPQLIREIIVP